MDSVLSPEAGIHLQATVQSAVKVVIAGPFAVGKTTFVGALSEIPPLRTEEIMTHAGATVDNLDGVTGKNTTTVAMDFGRLTLNSRLVLYLFGAPGQQRFHRLWHDLTHGALGALVLVDPRRLEDCFPIVNMVEERGLPYAIAVNLFDGAPTFAPQDLRHALDLEDHTPLVTCDARDKASAASALIALIRYLFARRTLEHA